MIPSKNHQNLYIPKKSIFDFVEVEYMKMEEMTLEKSCDPPLLWEKRRIKLRLNNKSCREFFKE